MNKLKRKKIISFILDLIIFIIIFSVSYSTLKNILPYHFEMGPGNTDVIEYDIITPFAGSLLIIFLFRFISLLLLNSSFGMRLNRLQFNKNGFSLLKYDTGIYLLIISLILFSQHMNFGQHCCGLVDNIEFLLTLILFSMIAAGIILWVVLFAIRKKSMQIKLR